MISRIHTLSIWRYALIFLIGSFIVYFFRPQATEAPVSWWEVQSIDTMKYSRDPSREKLRDPSYDRVIDLHVKNIAQTGATHVAIGTPYDAEFLPIMKRWVAAARRYNLNVWFRGNWSGWERWFGYPSITRDEHMGKTESFIRDNSDLFVDGDIFTPCTECENGGPGDPRKTGDAAGHRAFLIDEYRVTKEAFRRIGRDVRSNFNSMNGDVARLIMDKDTTQALGNIVVIDHYVASADNLVRDIKDIAKRSGGKVMLGEFGAPIPDIHGAMTDEQQAEWLSTALGELAQIPELIGVNYWVSVGGSTQLWNEKNQARPAVKVLRSFYTPKVANATVTDELQRPIANARVSSDIRTATTDTKGKFQLPYIGENETIDVGAQGFKEKKVLINQNNQNTNIVLTQDREGLLFTVLKFLRQLLKPL